MGRPFHRQNNDISKRKSEALRTAQFAEHRKGLNFAYLLGSAGFYASEFLVN